MMAIARTIWRILTLTCDESTRLTSDSLDERLPPAERLAVRLHALGCANCRRFFRQVSFLREAASRLARGDAGRPEIVLSERARREIERAVEDARDGPAERG